MKLFYIFAMILAFAGAAQAGTLSEPMVESAVEEAAGGSSIGILPVILVLGVAAVILIDGPQTPEACEV